MTTETGLRRFVLAAAIALSGGIVVELVLAEHLATWLQLVPFALATAGAGGAVIALIGRGRPLAIGAARAIFVLVAAGALFGIWEHVSHNFAFEAEIRPTASTRAHLVHAAYGASPALAPGMLALVAALGLAGTWRHSDSA